MIYGCAGLFVKIHQWHDGAPCYSTKRLELPELTRSHRTLDTYCRTKVTQNLCTTSTAAKTKRIGNSQHCLSISPLKARYHLITHTFRSHSIPRDCPAYLHHHSTIDTTVRTAQYIHLTSPRSILHGGSNISAQNRHSPRSRPIDVGKVRPKSVPSKLS